MVADMLSAVSSITPSSQEEALIEEAKQGSTGTSDELYTSHSTAIYRYISAGY